jgi:sporulation protein YqfC
MKIIDGIRNYVIEQEFEIRIINNKVDVINYKDIGHFDSNKVIINYSDGSVVIKGNNLVVSKLMNDEILIGGEIKGLELR